MKRYYTAYKLNNGKYAVALYDPDRNMYYRKMTDAEKRITGAHTYCANNPVDLGGTYAEFETLSAAKKYAAQRTGELDNAMDV